MINPINAMHSFQKELLRGNIQLQPGDLNPDLFVYLDNPEDGKFRITYVRLESKTVTAFVNFVLCEPIEQTPCFQIGYAVAEEFRNKGQAKKIIEMAISEMRNGYQSAGITTFYVEAIVDANNKPSLRVAEQTLSAKPVGTIDKFSGLPAFQYLRKII